MSKKAPHRHDAPKHSKKGKKPFTAKSAKQIRRAFKLGMLILEALMEVVRLIDRIRNIGGVTAVQRENPSGHFVYDMEE